MVVIISLLFVKQIFPQEINTETAKGYFSELKAIADKDNGKIFSPHLLVVFVGNCF